MGLSSKDTPDGPSAPAWAFCLASWALDRLADRRAPIVLDSPRYPPLRPSRVAPKRLKPTILFPIQNDASKALVVLFECNRRALDLLRPGRRFEMSDYRRYARAALLVAVLPRGELLVREWRATSNAANQLARALWAPTRFRSKEAA